MFKAKSSLRSLVISIICALAGTAAAAPVFSNIYVLGDSLSDQGNLFDATRSLTGNGLPASDHYVDGRFSNGEVYSGLLAQRLGLTLAATSRGGNNFAYGGTRTDYNRVEGPRTPGGFDPQDPGGFTPGLYPWTLNSQRQAFAARNIFDPNALYVVFSGSNDIADLLSGRAPSASPAAVINGAVQGIVDAILAFKTAGARYILVPDIPDLGVVPVVTVNGPRASAGGTALSGQFNSVLHATLSAISGVKIIGFDTFNFVREIRNRPADFGFTNVTQGCYSGYVDPAKPTDTLCSTPQSYAYFDQEHPTTALHSILADRMFAAVDAAVVPEPESYALVLVALAGLGVARHGKGKGKAAP